MVTSIPNSGPDPRGTFRLLRSLPSPLIPGQAASSDPSYTTSLDSNILIDKSLHLVEKTTQIHWGMSMRIGAHCHAGLFIAMVLLLSSCADQEPLEDICEDCSENETDCDQEARATCDGAASACVSSKCAGRDGIEYVECFEVLCQPDLCECLDQVGCAWQDQSCDGVLAD